jgi:CxxC-x17-CxxC domain-containing protein
MTSSDKTLVCRDCGQEFIFTTGEQEFYTSRGFQEPMRCPGCRSARRRERVAGYGQSDSSYSVVCSACGKEATVPFEPKKGRPVYCRECYLKVRQSQPDSSPLKY